MSKAFDRESNAWPAGADTPEGPVDPSFIYGEDSGVVTPTKTGDAEGKPGRRPLILCENLVKIYKVADLEVVALQGLDLTIYPGEMIGIVGNSGSGKTTLLNILGGLDRPSAGRVLVGGRDLLKVSDRQLVGYKREVVGFVWQQTARNLIPYLTAIENVELPMLIAGRFGRKERAWAREIIAAVGLDERRNHKLSQLSGGEQQRVSIAIALANRPPLLLADEPTGSVDTETAVKIFGIFRDLCRNYGTTVLIVTHDGKVMFQVDRVLAIRDGKTSAEIVRRVEADLDKYTDSLIVAGETHDAYVMLDSAGRMQLPRQILEELGISSKVVLERRDDEIVIRAAPDE
jgi:ABC-type lipoprotein export system ATPase subunit